MRRSVRTSVTARNKCDLIGSLIGLGRGCLGFLALWGGWMFFVDAEWVRWTDASTIHLLALAAGLFGNLYLKAHEEEWSKRLAEAHEVESEARWEARQAARKK